MEAPRLRGDRTLNEMAFIGEFAALLLKHQVTIFHDGPTNKLSMRGEGIYLDVDAWLKRFSSLAEPCFRVT